IALELEINVESFPPQGMRQQVLGVQARIFDPAFFEVSGGGLKNVEDSHLVIPSKNATPARSKPSRGAAFEVTPRDPTTALRFARGDISSSARCLSIVRPNRQLAALKSFPRARLP